MDHPTYGPAAGILTTSSAKHNPNYNETSETMDMKRQEALYLESHYSDDRGSI